MLDNLHQTNISTSAVMIENLKRAATKNSNIFESLMEAAMYCSIGQITDALFEVGGQYRRNM
jgi:methylmalonyl-CoA mutase